jgi:hypothetical protein
MLMVGSVTPDGSVKLSFSPIGAVNANDPTTQTITIGDGRLSRQGADAAFLMRMTSGTASASVTHWAYMLPVMPNDPEWRSLPGYPTTGVPDLTGLQTQIAYVGAQPTKPVALVETFERQTTTVCDFSCNRHPDSSNLTAVLPHLEAPANQLSRREKGRMKNLIHPHQLQFSRTLAERLKAGRLHALEFEPEPMVLPLLLRGARIARPKRGS